METAQTLIENLREKRGLEIANKRVNQIKRIDDSNYEVLSQSGDGGYLVSQIEDDWVCECPDHGFRRGKIHAYLGSRTELKNKGASQKGHSHSGNNIFGMYILPVTKHREI